MLWLVTALARLAQFMGTALLFGGPLFFLYGLPAQGRTAAANGTWPRPFLAAAAAAMGLGALMLLVAQTATMTGDPAAVFDPGSIWSVLSETEFGWALAVRLLVALLAVHLCLLTSPSRALWAGLAALGAVALASFGWTGHGAADDGAAGLVHLGADLIHLWAAGVWIGALAVLAMLLTASRRNRDDLALKTLHDGLAGFSGIGTVVVAALVVTGLVNSWFLVGPSHLSALWGSAYGLLLVGKLAIFAVMLGLAAVNRFRLTPALSLGLASGSPDQAVDALRRSVLIESGAALGVIVLVSILGTLAPPSAMG